MHDYRGSDYARAALALFTLLVLSAFMLLSQWLSVYEPFEWKKELGTLMSVLTVVFVWAAAWAVIGRFVTGKNLFVVHFAASAIFVVVADVADILTTYLAYALNMGLFWEITAYMIFS